MEGLPYARMNDRILDDLPKKAIKFTNIENYHLIDPKRKSINTGKPYPFGDPETLPSMVCVAGLKNMVTANRNIGGKSELTLIFFQDTFGPPFEKEILSEIQKLSWFDHAQNIPWDVW